MPDARLRITDHTAFGITVFIWPALIAGGGWLTAEADVQISITGATADSDRQRGFARRNSDGIARPVTGGGCQIG